MNILISDYFLFIAAILWLIVASLSDLKKREVANWLSFSLIAVALGVRAITSIITLEYSYFLNGLLFAFIFFILANLLYYTKIFAGGDAKLLIALGALFATTPVFASFDNQFNLPFPSIFLLNTLVIASFYGILYSIGLSLQNWNSFKQSFIHLYIKTKIFRAPLLIIIFLSIVLTFLSRRYEFLFFIALVFIFPYLYIFVKAVENTCLVRIVRARDLTEGDWIIHSINIGKKIISPSVDGLSRQDILLLKKHNKKVEVKYGIPFIPVFLITAVISVLFGNLFYILADIMINLL